MIAHASQMSNVPVTEGVLEIRWPTVRSGRVGSLVWRVRLRLTLDGVEVLEQGAAWDHAPEGGGLACDVPEPSLAVDAAGLWHLDAPGALSATIRPADARQPGVGRVDVLYARAPGLLAGVPGGSCDRPAATWTALVPDQDPCRGADVPVGLEGPAAQAP